MTNRRSFISTVLAAAALAPVLARMKRKQPRYSITLEWVGPATIVFPDGEIRDMLGSGGMNLLQDKATWRDIPTIAKSDHNSTRIIDREYQSSSFSTNHRFRTA